MIHDLAELNEVQSGAVLVLDGLAMLFAGELQKQGEDNLKVQWVVEEENLVEKEGAIEAVVLKIVVKWVAELVVNW